MTYILPENFNLLQKSVNVYNPATNMIGERWGVTDAINSKENTAAVDQIPVFMRIYEQGIVVTDNMVRNARASREMVRDWEKWGLLIKSENGNAFFLTPKADCVAGNIVQVCKAVADLKLVTDRMGIELGLNREDKTVYQELQHFRNQKKSHQEKTEETQALFASGVKDRVIARNKGITLRDVRTLRMILDEKNPHG